MIIHEKAAIPTPIHITIARICIGWRKQLYIPIVTGSLIFVFRKFSVATAYSTKHTIKRELPMMKLDQ